MSTYYTRERVLKKQEPMLLKQILFIGYLGRANLLVSLN